MALQVRVGNTTYYIGELELVASANRFLLSVPFTAGVAAASGILMTVVVLICVAYRRKSRESQRIVRRMQTQMDALEARVATECKEGVLTYLLTHLFKLCRFPVHKRLLSILISSAWMCTTIHKSFVLAKMFFRKLSVGLWWRSTACQPFPFLNQAHFFLTSRCPRRAQS